MALFRKKPKEGDAAGETTAASATGFTPQPETAQKFFEYARGAADSFNYEYAMELYARGLRQDPTSIPAHEALFQAGQRFIAKGGKPASGKDLRKLDDGTPIGRLIAAEYEWVRDLQNLKAALRAVELAVKADMLEVGHWFSPFVLGLLRRMPRKSRSQCIQAMSLFRQVEAWDAAMAAGGMAQELDPSDADLANDLKNLAAQRAMDQGGYTQNVGQEGSFLASIRDADRQREIAEDESLAGAGSSEERALERARLALEKEPASPDAINRYAQLLKKTGRPDMVEEACSVYARGYEATREYRFRMAEGDIRIEQKSEAARQAAAEAAAHPDDTARAGRAASLRAELLALRLSEYEERVARYPTDRFRKYDLGDVQYQLGRYQDAMVQFQAAMDEPKLQARAGHMLGRCFLAEQWFTDAIPVFEEAIRSVDLTDKDTELALKYDLLEALLGAAEQEQSIDHARDAKTLCSEIMRRNIAYRDIRQRRVQVDEIIRRLSGE
ncbi:MAG: hypothetical protein KF817_12990 [Phycisphaeraceae bacterium]|nr:hypothetical protein [Phycisphaeraceae bacterium]